MTSQIKDYERHLRRLLNKVNKITAAHRHGNTVSGKMLDDLYERQLEVEQFIEEATCNLEP